MLGRSAEAGCFFRLSDSFVPMIDGLPLEEIDPGSGAGQIDVNFKEDWVGYLRRVALPACGLKYSSAMTPEKNTLRFLNARGRIPSAKARRVHKSRELSIPLEYAPDYEKLIALVEAGGDLKPYLSRDILKKKRPDRNDGLLNSWGVQHLHFCHAGTDHILFCVITDTDVFVIQALPHAAEHLWVNTQLIQILHDNWPALIVRGKHSGLRPEVFPAAKRSSLRGYNANFPITVSDGTVYLPPAGGTMASGDSQEAWVNCDKIFSELEHWQRAVAQNVSAIRAALKMPDSIRLVVRMAFNNRDCCFYVPTHAVRLGGFALTDGAK